MSEKQEINISIANCAGRSNIGQMSVEIAKIVDRTLPYANINCLPAIFPDLKPAEKFKEADAIVVIDGCKEACVRETILKGGFKPALWVAPDETFGVEKTPGLDYDEKVMLELADKIIVLINSLYEKLREEKAK